MSRLIVKNLPKNITEDKLRKLFSEKGLITDIQLKYTPDGKFRRFAFVGYQDENEANEAVKYFDKMCLNTNVLSVQHCASLGDSNKPKPWSKYAPENAVQQTNDKSETVHKKTKKKATNLLEKYKTDPRFKEFMQVHAPKEVHLLDDKSNEQPQETELEEENKEEVVSENEASENKLAYKNISDAEYMQQLMKGKKQENIKSDVKPEAEKKKIQLYTVKLHGLPYACKKKDVKQFFRPLVVPYTIRLPQKIKGIAYVGFKTEKNMNKALLKNKSFLNGKRILVSKYSGKNGENSSNNDPKKHKWKNQEEMLKNEESITESGRIFVRNLAYTTTENDIKELFEKYGPLTEVNIPIDPITRKQKGFGIITFLMPEHAVKAYSDLDGSILHGRMLHLLPGKSKDAENPQSSSESTNYKQKKLAKQKAQAGSSHNWNALFLGHDAVAGAIADNFVLSKEEVLAPHGEGNAAVRLALGETQIVASTRKFLEGEGVVLDAFNQSTTKRSNTIILVKNLPGKTDPIEIRQTFEKFGVLGRVILPPSGLTAVVEFLEPSEARKAFGKLAYSRFKSVPLFLEWAPENCLKEVANKPAKERIEKEVQKKDLKDEEENNESSLRNEDVEKHDEEIEDEEEPEENTTIFVKNLNFETSDEGLRKHFEACGKIHYANVAMKKSKNSPNGKLSMGFGFVQFYRKQDADKALKTLQQSSLDGKSLELKRSERTLKEQANTARKATKRTKQTGTKILVRNVPFQATKNEISELFRTFGEIKALRLPKKVGFGEERHRGFAFVDFVTESDAKAAFEALCQSTHLYGRRLVLEWASVDEDVDQLRKRTADHFTPTENVKSKKSVFDITS